MHLTVRRWPSNQLKASRVHDADSRRGDKRMRRILPGAEQTKICGPRRTESQIPSPMNLHEPNHHEQNDPPPGSPAAVCLDTLSRSSDGLGMTDRESKNRQENEEPVRERKFQQPAGGAQVRGDLEPLLNIRLRWPLNVGPGHQ